MSVASRFGSICLCLLIAACTPVRPAVPRAEWGAAPRAPSALAEQEPDPPSVEGAPAALPPSDPEHSAEGAGASLSARLRLSEGFPNQVVPAYRRYLTGGTAAIKGGDLILELCGDRGCGQVAAHFVVEEGTVLGNETAHRITLEGLPAGNWFARFGLDTTMSRRKAGAYGLDDGFGPFDVLQLADSSALPTLGDNPAAGTVAITLREGTRFDLGEVVLGSIVFEEISRPPAAEEGWLLAASSGDEGYRNVLRRVDLRSYEVDEIYALAFAGEEGVFRGDICGLVPAEDGLVYVIASRLDGAYISAFDATTMSFLPAKAVHVPHPAVESGAKMEPDMVPWPCRGTVVSMEGRRFLYLVSFKGAGARTSSQPYPLVAVEVTGMSGPGETGLVAAYDESVMPFFNRSRVLRAAASDGSSLFLLEPSWSKLADQTTIWSLALLPGGTLSEPYRSFSAGYAGDTCGAANNWPPAMSLVSWGGTERLAVGSDDGLHVFDTSGEQVSFLDLRGYGSLVTSLAVSPDRSRLYALPSCKSSTSKATLQRGLGPERSELDRHAVAVVDLGSDPADPALLFEDRDLDGDGESDGGVELEYLQLNQRLLHWCPDCPGALPPTTYAGPEIAAGARSLFLRGGGGEGDEIGVSGLGRSGDVGVFDVGAGHGVLFRGTNPWIDGPDARWGYDLDPASPGRGLSDDVSVSALVFVPRR